MEKLSTTHFAPETTYLNTASAGLLPAPAVAAMAGAVEDTAAGRSLTVHYEAVEAARASYARLVGVAAERVAAGGSVAVYAGLIAQSLPPGSEVLVAEGDFSSLVNPFHMRPDLTVRTVPLEKLPDAVRPGTALVAVSAVQSADGRIADLDAVAAAAGAHGARTFIDVSQAAGWLTLDANDYDYTAAVCYKWLLCPRGAAFLTTPADPTDPAVTPLTPSFAGWVSGEQPWDSCYGAVEELAQSARRFDESPSLYSYVAARHSLALIEELGVDAIGAHDRALADRFRRGLAGLGHTPVPAEGSAIVSVPGLGGHAADLAEQGIQLSNRAGNLRAAFHLYNTEADVDRLLEVVGTDRAGRTQ